MKIGRTVRYSAGLADDVRRVDDLKRRRRLNGVGGRKTGEAT